MPSECGCLRNSIPHPKTDFERTLKFQPDEQFHGLGIPKLHIVKQEWNSSDEFGLRKPRHSGNKKRTKCASAMVALPLSHPTSRVALFGQIIFDRLSSSSVELAVGMRILRVCVYICWTSAYKYWRVARTNVVEVNPGLFEVLLWEFHGIYSPSQLHGSCVKDK